MASKRLLRVAKRWKESCDNARAVALESAEREVAEAESSLHEAYENWEVLLDGDGEDDDVTIKAGVGRRSEGDNGGRKRGVSVSPELWSGDEERPRGACARAPTPRPCSAHLASNDAAASTDMCCRADGQAASANSTAGRVEEIILDGFEIPEVNGTYRRSDGLPYFGNKQRPFCKIGSWNGRPVEFVVYQAGRYWRLSCIFPGSKSERGLCRLYKCLYAAGQTRPPESGWSMTLW